MDQPTLAEALRQEQQCPNCEAKQTCNMSDVDEAAKSLLARIELLEGVAVNHGACIDQLQKDVERLEARCESLTFRLSKVQSENEL
jgi:phage shock protein A